MSSNNNEVHIEIDGIQAIGKPNETILTVAKRYGVYIPTLCHLDGLTPAGACRICIVEVERARLPVISCATPIMEGMKIKTDTEMLRKSRKMTLELLLSEHPHDCMVCEQNGNCELQNLAYEYKVDNIRFPIKTDKEPLDDTSEVLIRNPNLCILCGRCVRACKEITIRDVYDFSERGFETRIIAGLNQLQKDTECVSCGECVQACPVGAITEKPSFGKGRIFEFTKTKTTCSYCGVGCQMYLHVRDNKIIKATGVKDEVNDNNGSLCVKGRFGNDYIHSPERLTSPYIRVNGKLEKATWDEAYDYITEKLLSIKEKHGPDSIAGLSSAKCTNEENYLFQKLFRRIIGTNNVDHCARL